MRSGPPAAPPDAGPASPYWCGTPVCVLGGTGFLGRHLVRRLLDAGARVRSLALPSHPVEPHPHLTLIEADVRDSAALTAAVAGARVVFNLAGPVAVGPGTAAALAAHRDAVRRVLDVLPADARLVHTSSVVAVGASPSPDVQTEDSPFTLHGLRVGYVHAKRAAEEEAAAAAAGGRDVLSVNPGYLFGPDDPGPSVMGRLCRRVWRGRVPAAPPGGFCCADVRDVAAGHLLAAEHGGSGRRYVLGGENLTGRGLIAAVAAAAGRRPRWVPRLPGPLFTALAAASELHGRLTGREPFPSLEHARLHRLYWYASSARARDELGYATRPLAATLADAFAWHAARVRLAPRGLNRWLFRPAGVSVKTGPRACR